MPRNEMHLESFLPNMFRDLVDGMAANMSRRITGPFRLTMTEWRILLHLADHQALTASDIVQYSGMEKSKVSRAVANLESLDLVERRVAEDDHRLKLLRMTGTGRKRYQALVPRVLDWERELIEGLETGEYRDLLFLLDKLGRHLKTMQELPEVSVARSAEPGAVQQPAAAVTLPQN
jgi:DNA-binding MarR family transcriptional regulator